MVWWWRWRGEKPATLNNLLSASLLSGWKDKWFALVIATRCSVLKVGRDQRPHLQYLQRKSLAPSASWGCLRGVKGLVSASGWWYPACGQPALTGHR